MQTTTSTSVYCIGVINDGWYAEFEAHSAPRPVSLGWHHNDAAAAQAAAQAHADLPPTPAQIMADPRVQALVNALERIAHASDVYGVEANAEDQGAETLAYAHKSTCNLARAALAQLKEPKP